MLELFNTTTVTEPDLTIRCIHKASRWSKHTKTLNLFTFTYPDSDKILGFVEHLMNNTDDIGKAVFYLIK